MPRRFPPAVIAAVLMAAGSRAVYDPHASSGQPRVKGRHSDKISQSLEDSEKQLRLAREKRARRGAVRLEAADRGQIERAPSADVDVAAAYALGVAECISDLTTHFDAYDLLEAYDRGRNDALAEAETSHQGPDQ